MKISYNWLKDYLDFDDSPQRLSEILTEIGLEVESLEKVESIRGGLAGIVTGEVRSVEAHPNADRLRNTVVDIGQPELLNIVCGAINVAPGQKVLVALPGTTLYPTDGEPFEIRKSKIRGIVSEGMICAEDEIGLGSAHEGILVLDADTAIGRPAAEVFHVTTDFVYEIGLTPNRSDATSHLGVARDLAAALTYLHNKPFDVKRPDVGGFHPDNITHDISVTVEDGILCPRYSSVTISDLKLGPSPQWMVDRLKSIGVRSINNVVDITNFILHETGQPLHAFDLRALKGSQVYVGCLEEGAIFKTLDGVDRKLSGEDLMICNSDHEPLCIAGVYGGAQSGVGADTKDIFLESAHFSATSVRKSSVWHNLRTDAARVFEKGSDPSITTYALKRASLLLKEYAGGLISSQISDEMAVPVERKQVKIRMKQVNKIVGIEIPEEKILSILEALDMDILKLTMDEMVVAIPTSKVDVTREADVIEEILRIYGFNNIPIDNKLEMSLDSGHRDLQLKYRDKVSTILSGMGFDETMTLSFSLPRYLRMADNDTYVKINNTSNKDLEIMRSDLISSALSTVEYNQNRQNDALHFYEFGRSYLYEQESFQEENHLTITIAGSDMAGNWIMPQPPQGFYYLKSVVTRILDALNIHGYQEAELSNDAFKYGIRLHRGGEEMAELGMIDLMQYPGTDIRNEVFLGDIKWDVIFRMATAVRETATVSKYPAVARDLALVVPPGVKFYDIKSEINRIGGRLIRDVSLFDVYEDNEQLGEGVQSYGVKILFSDHDKTLKDNEVEQKISIILDNLHKKWGISLR